MAPAIAGANVVVSDIGESLSPKYAPDIIAPAITGLGNPSPSPIPTRAIPTVEAVLHELPVERDTIEHIITVTGKNTNGLIIFKP